MRHLSILYPNGTRWHDDFPACHKFYPVFNKTKRESIMWLNFLFSRCDSFMMTRLLSRVKILCNRKKLFSGKGLVMSLLSKGMFKGVARDLLVICINKISPVAWMASVDKTKAGLLLNSVPSEKGKSTDTISPCLKSIIYFSNLSHRASSGLSQSLAREASLIEAFSIAIFLARVKGITFNNLFFSSSFRNVRPSGMLSFIVRIYSAMN